MQTTPPGAPDFIDTQALISDPHAVYAELRQAGPVHRIMGPDGLPAWLVTRYDDVKQALCDPRLSLDRERAIPGNYQGFSLPPALNATLLNMDPPDHTRVRRLVGKAFTPGRIHALRRPVTNTALALLDALADQAQVDLIAEYAAPLPIIVICDLLGVEQQQRHDFRSWTDALITPDRSRPDQAKQALRRMLEFLTALIARKRAVPAEDLLSALIAARDDGDKLTEDELMSLAFLILFAGYENTVHLIGNAVLTLFDHPETLRELRADPAKLGDAVEEFARFDTPTPVAIRRFPIEPITIGDTVVPAGETVLLSLASANRDPAHAADPDRFDVRRRQSGQLWLGHGIHYCLGASLARLEVEIALAVLLGRFPGLALAVPRSELRWRPSFRVRGLQKLPVVLR